MIELHRGNISRATSQELVTTSAKGNFKVIQNLLRVLSTGLASKKEVDDAIDCCNQFENIRDSIMEFAIKARTDNTTEKKIDDFRKAVYQKNLRSRQIKEMTPIFKGFSCRDLRYSEKSF